jgi:hypothetical protein
VTLKRKKNDRAEGKEVALKKSKRNRRERGNVWQRGNPKEEKKSKRNRIVGSSSSSFRRVHFLLCSLRSRSLFFLDSVASMRIAPVFPPDRSSQFVSEDCQKLDPSNFQQLELQFLS